MNFKMPEPCGATYSIAGIQHCTITEVLPDTNLYTEAQLNQSVLNTLEAAAAECERMMMYPRAKQESAAHDNVWKAAEAIRAMKESIK